MIQNKCIKSLNKILFYFVSLKDGYVEILTKTNLDLFFYVKVKELPCRKEKKRKGKNPRGNM